MNIENQNNIYDKFIKNGFTDIIYIDVHEELLPLQKKIYEITKPLLVDHEDNLSILEKIKLPFKRTMMREPTTVTS